MKNMKHICNLAAIVVYQGNCKMTLWVSIFQVKSNALSKSGWPACNHLWSLTAYNAAGNSLQKWNKTVILLVLVYIYLKSNLYIYINFLRYTSLYFHAFCYIMQPFFFNYTVIVTEKTKQKQTNKNTQKKTNRNWPQSWWWV